MNWARQVAHVAAKDARMARYAGAAFSLLVLLQAYQVGGGWITAWSLLMVLTGLVVVAQVVHADPAVRGDAFWISRPLSAGAVFAAKVAGAVALVSIVAGGELVVLARHGVVGADFTRILLANVGAEAMILAVGLLLAALTRDIRSFLLAVVGLLMVWGLAAALLSMHAWRMPVSVPRWLVPLLVGAGALAVAGYQYRSGRRAWASVAAVALLAVSVLAASMGGRALLDRPGAADRPLPPTLQPDSLVAWVQAPSPRRIGPRHVMVRLFRASPEAAYVLTGGALEVRRPDGSHGMARTALPTALTPFGAVAPPVPGARWVNLQQDYALFAAGLTDITDRLASTAGTPQRLRGVVEAWRPRLDARMPLRPGASIVRAGERVRIVAAEVGNDGVDIEVATSSLDGGDSPFIGSPGRMEFALLDRGRGIVFPLARGRSSGTAGGVLPGSPRLMDAHLRLPPGPATRVMPSGSGPYELLSVRWRVVGGYGVSVPIGVQKP